MQDVVAGTGHGQLEKVLADAPPMGWRREEEEDACGGYWWVVLLTRWHVGQVSTYSVIAAGIHGHHTERRARESVLSRPK